MLKWRRRSETKTETQGEMSGTNVDVPHLSCESNPVSTLRDTVYISHLRKHQCNIACQKFNKLREKNPLVPQ